MSFVFGVLSLRVFLPGNIDVGRVKKRKDILF